GEQGPQGEQGPPGSFPGIYVDFAGTTATQNLMTVEAFCDPGDIAISGGFVLTDEIIDFAGSSFILASIPNGGATPSSWRVTAEMPIGDFLEVHVVCAQTP
ncbi:MAG: hypothetical protein ACR2N7_01520, partial [Acidimicrobiia bacterium]